MLRSSHKRHGRSVSWYNQSKIFGLSVSLRSEALRILYKGVGSKIRAGGNKETTFLILVKIVVNVHKVIKPVCTRPALCAPTSCTKIFGGRLSHPLPHPLPVYVKWVEVNLTARVDHEMYIKDPSYLYRKEIYVWSRCQVSEVPLEMRSQLNGWAKKGGRYYFNGVSLGGRKNFKKSPKLQ